MRTQCSENTLLYWREVVSVGLELKLEEKVKSLQEHPVFIDTARFTVAVMHVQATGAGTLYSHEDLRASLEGLTRAYPRLSHIQNAGR